MHDRFVADQLAGAEAGLAAHDIAPVCTELVEEHMSDDSAIEAACQNIINKGTTAIHVIANDDMAVLVINKLEKMGVLCSSGYVRHRLG